MSDQKFLGEARPDYNTVFRSHCNEDGSREAGAKDTVAGVLRSESVTTPRQIDGICTVSPGDQGRTLRRSGGGARGEEYFSGRSSAASSDDLTGKSNERAMLEGGLREA
jgi:hypothetical protein